jgi:hypothetical protein
LILVFLGVLVGAYQPLVGKAADKTLRRFKFAACSALGVFGISLVSVVLDACWLAVGGGHCFYNVLLAMFFVQLGALAAIAWYSTVHVLLKG